MTSELLGEYKAKSKRIKTTKKAIKHKKFCSFVVNIKNNY